MSEGLAADRKNAAAGFELHRPHRHLDLRDCRRCSCGCRPATALRRSGAADAIRNLPEGMEWAEYASHSHNGYLDTALSMGLPGLALLIAVLVIAPLRNFQAADRGGNNGPLAMALLRIWLFGLYLSSLESFFLDRADPTLVHVSAGGVRPALSGALSRQGVRPSESAPAPPARHPATSRRNRTAPAPMAISAPRRSCRRRPRHPIRAQPARWRRDRSIP